MGIKESKYEFIEEKDETLSVLPTLPPVYLHPKGKPYSKLMEMKLKSKIPYEWSHYKINDLRVVSIDTKSPWYYGMMVFGDELECTFCIASLKNDKIVIDNNISLKYSTESNNYTTIMEGCNKKLRVRLELYADNIHCQRQPTGKKLID